MLRDVPAPSESSEPIANDSLAFHHPDEPGPSLTGAVGRKCVRHRWAPLHGYLACSRCGAIQDPERSRRGRTSRSRGNARERELAKALGGTRVGMFGGPSDVVTDRWSVQSKVRKAWPEWMQAELTKLPRTGGRIPILIVTDAPGSGIRRRSIVVMELADFRSLYGTVEGEP